MGGVVMNGKAYLYKRSHVSMIVLAVLLSCLLLGFPGSIQASSIETETIMETSDTVEGQVTSDPSTELGETFTEPTFEQVSEPQNPGTNETLEDVVSEPQPSDPASDTSEPITSDDQDAFGNETEVLVDEGTGQDETGSDNSQTDETEVVSEETSTETEDIFHQDTTSDNELDDDNSLNTDSTEPTEPTEITEPDNAPENSTEETTVGEELDTQNTEEAPKVPSRTMADAQAIPQYEVREIGGNLYIVDTVTNEIRKDNAWVEINGKYYFPNAEGKLYQNRWITFGPDIAHYMGEDGAAYTGVHQVNNNLHLFDDLNYQRGVLRKDNAWVDYDNKLYFPNASGNLYHDRIITFGPENLYYMGSDGTRFNGTKVVNYGDRILLFGNNGRTKTPTVGWYDSDGKHYFANEAGQFYRNRWITFGPSIAHYMGSDGAAYTGVKAVGEDLHLFDNLNLQRGVLRKDNAWVKYDGKEYFPNAEGNLYHDRIITFGPTNHFYLGSDGSKFNSSKVVNFRDQILLFGDNGKAKTPTVGWYDIDGKHFFANEKGEFYRNQWITFGPSIAHYMGSDGAAYTGVRTVGSNLHLFDGRNMRRGVLRKDNTWVEYEGKDYYPRYDGKLYRNQVVTSSNGTLYYVDGNGSKLNSNKIVRYNNRLYMFGKGSTIQKLNNWVTLDGSRYFVTSNGSLHFKSIRMINGQEYLFDANGRSSATNSGYRYTVKLSVPWSSQLTPIYAPNGCEMASALGALRYHGYDRGVSLSTLLAEMPRHSNPQYGFNTNPYGTALGTIYPNALLPSLQKYAPNSVDISWSTVDGWRREIDNGNPVVLWCTSGFYSPYYGGLSYPSNTHVQLITGYSAENNTFALMDPYTWSSSASLKIVNSYTLANSNAWGGRYAIAIR